MDTPKLEGVEKPAIAWLVKLGYTHLSGADVAHRHRPARVTQVLAGEPAGSEPERLGIGHSWQQFQLKDARGRAHSVRFIDQGNLDKIRCDAKPLKTVEPQRHEGSRFFAERSSGKYGRHFA